MIRKYPLIFFAVLLAGMLAAALLVGPIFALAEDDSPSTAEAPPADPSEETPVTEALPEDNPAFADDPPVQETPAADETPVEEPLPGEIPTEEVIHDEPIEEPAPEETPQEEGNPDETEPVEVTEETPVDEDSPEVGEETPTEPAPTSPSADIVFNPLPDTTGLMPSPSVSDETTIQEEAFPAGDPESAYAGPDPYIDRLDGRYRFLPLGGCAAYGGVSAYCVESGTPLQAAINAANDGEVINVEAGTYTEQVEIFDITLTLRGWGNPIITAPGPMTASGSIYALIYASNAHLNIEGFTIDASASTDGDALTTNSIYGVYYLNSSGIVANNTILSNANTDDETTGVSVENNAGVETGVVINQNTISDHNHSGIQAQGGRVSTTISNNLINTSASAANDITGISVAGISNNTISGNTISGNHDQGIHTQNSDSNIITYNSISNTSQNGILLTNSSGNRVILNVITGADEDLDTSAIRLEENSDNNFIAQNTLSGNSIAVLVLNGSDNTTITENRITGNLTGILVAADAGEDEPLNTAIYWNILTGNTFDIANITSSTLYAALNWWGCPEGLPTCGSVFGNVDTSAPLPYNPDPDADMVFGSRDNCPFVYNPSQWDSDGDGIGDACDDNVRTYRIESVDAEEDIRTFSFTLSEDESTELVLVDMETALTETALLKLVFPLDVAAPGTLLSFEQVLEEMLPKPLGEGISFKGPAFTLSATAKNGARLEELDSEMELRWLLEDGYTPPNGYQLAVYYFDTDTFYWITETWQEVEVVFDAAENALIANSTLPGTFVLVLTPED